ncbi:MAG: DUF3122 domain-containing protein [Cyanobacteria bacterium P01_C01_bin.69]
MLQRQYLWRRFFVVLSLCALLFCLRPATTLAAHMPVQMASLHTYQELPGQTTFRSKQSLRDRSDRSWQVIAFKRYQADTLQGLYLRLVGFPGLVAIDGQKPLKISTRSSLEWQASPELDPQTSSLPENANQYNVETTMNALASDIPLQIDIPLEGGSVAQLVVPPFSVKEWRELVAQVPGAE